jgi:hypothetical protein
MVYDHNFQATHCREEPTWTERWFSPKVDGTWWRVCSCGDHLKGLTGLREFGRPNLCVCRHGGDSGDLGVAVGPPEALEDQGKR